MITAQLFCGDDANVGLFAHFEDELTAFHKVIVHDIHLIVGLAVKGNFADIFVFRRVVESLDGEFAGRNFDFGNVENRGAEPVAAARGLDLIEA